jgi:hypothetical protein
MPLFFEQRIRQICFDSWEAQLSAYYSQECASVTKKFVTMRLHDKATEEADVQMDFEQPMNSAMINSLIEKAVTTKTKHLQQQVDPLTQQSTHNPSASTIPNSLIHRGASPACASLKKKKNGRSQEESTSALRKRQSHHGQ